MFQIWLCSSFHDGASWVLSGNEDIHGTNEGILVLSYSIYQINYVAILPPLYAHRREMDKNLFWMPKISLIHLHAVILNLSPKLVLLIFKYSKLQENLGFEKIIILIHTGKYSSVSTKIENLASLCYGAFHITLQVKYSDPYP